MDLSTWSPGSGGYTVCGIWGDRWDVGDPGDQSGSCRAAELLEHLESDTIERTNSYITVSFSMSLLVLSENYLHQLVFDFSSK